MGREFDELFDKWSVTYDDFVAGKDEQYREVFQHYEAILSNVANKAFGTVLEFGVGTGNLTKKLLEKNLKVIGVEPSKEMRIVAAKKLPPSLTLQDGDFFSYNTSSKIDCIVSTYSFHHLTDDEKEKAISLYSKTLQTGGKIIFADTMFESEQYFSELKREARNKNYHDLLYDLETEYYPYLSTIQAIFTNHSFTIELQKMNRYVWLIEATKQVKLK